MASSSSSSLSFSQKHFNCSSCTLTCLKLLKKLKKNRVNSLECFSQQAKSLRHTLFLGRSQWSNWPNEVPFCRLLPRSTASMNFLFFSLQGNREILPFQILFFNYILKPYEWLSKTFRLSIMISVNLAWTDLYVYAKPPVRIPISFQIFTDPWT